MTQRFCRVCSGWHDMDEPWPHQIEVRNGIQIMKDIEPYKAVGVDVATGNAPVITSRSEHRAYLRRNGYVEVGNEKLTPPKPQISTVSKREIKQVLDQFRRR